MSMQVSSWRRGASFVAITGMVVVLIVASPIALQWIAKSQLEWKQLSDVGQAYGFASSLLSGLALLSIAGSLFFQARQTKIAQLQTSRMMQLELFKLAYEHPDLQASWGRSIDEPYQQWRKKTYLNLIFMYMRMTYLMKSIDDDDLRRMMANRFKTPLGREYWQSARHAFATGNTGRRDRRFLKIVNSEYLRALNYPALNDVESNYPSPKNNPSNFPTKGTASRPRVRSKTKTGFTIYGFLLVAASVAIRRFLKRSN